MLQEFNDHDNVNYIFNCIREFIKKVLVEYDYKPYCRFEQLLRWRQLAHKVDQDVLVAAFFAQRDIESGRERTNFTWEPVIKTDNFRLHNMLQEGMAENHFHLKGSAPCYQLSWISLMNRVKGRKEEYKQSTIESNKLNRDVWFEEGIAKQSINDLVTKAAVIRSILFSEFLHPELSARDVAREEQEVDEQINNEEETKEHRLSILMNSLMASNEHLVLYYEDIEDHLAILRWQCALEIPFQGREYRIDYAIDKRNYTEDNDNYNLLLYGERKLMYDCFRKIFGNGDKTLQDEKYEQLFYIYLIIKNRFRSEMIQVNERVGFKNFSDYQDRKTVFLKKEPILRNAVNYMAIQATHKEQNICKLEVRIAPEDTLDETMREIKSIDTSTRHSPIKRNDIKWLMNKERGQITKHLPYSHFYVIHAIKGRDDKGEKVLGSKQKELLLMRDVQKRRKAKDLAYQLMNMREKRMSTASRIYGVDAASNEIGCRPEVFAQAFRLLKQHTVSKQFDRLKYLELQLNLEEHGLKENPIEETLAIPPIKLTYHAGEDFLDVADGLRAIDEAITYMNMSFGERISHALALGIDVKEWYQLKDRTIVLPKQDYLDNVCWLINKIDLLHIEVEQSAYNLLQREFRWYFEEIYDMRKEDLFHVNYRDYYNAWFLRGDNPKCYEKGEYSQEPAICFWDRCNINEQLERGEEIRHNRIASQLYYRYHFDFKVRERGAEIMNKKVELPYIKVVEAVQKAMQQKLRSKGIGIETNPSSNYLIGTFKRYDKHPLINFYNLGLTYDAKRINESPQLMVSINTDDQAVFGTYLENEYALMALALQKAKDEEGHELYNQEMIYDWLNRIRLMGLQQSFYVTHTR